MSSYVDDPIGLALIELHDVADQVTVDARLGNSGRWKVTVRALGDGRLVVGRGESVGSFDPVAAFKRAVADAKVKLTVDG